MKNIGILMAQADTRKGGGSDLPTAQTTANAAQIAAATQPWNVLEIKQSLSKVAPGKLKHAGGALPLLFGQNPKEGDAQLVRYLGTEVVPAEKNGGEAFVCLNFDVLDHRIAELPAIYRAQLILNTSLETYFECKPKLVGKEELMVPERDVEKTPILLISYAGSVANKKNGFAAFRRWIVEEFTPAKKA